MAKLTKAQIAAQTEAKRQANKIKLFDLMFRCKVESELNIECEMVVDGDDDYGHTDHVGAIFRYWSIHKDGDGDLSYGEATSMILTLSSDEWRFDCMTEHFELSRQLREQKKRHEAERQAALAKLSDLDRKRLGVR